MSGLFASTADITGNHRVPAALGTHLGTPARVLNTHVAGNHRVPAVLGTHVAGNHTVPTWNTT